MAPSVICGHRHPLVVLEEERAAFYPPACLASAGLPHILISSVESTDDQRGVTGPLAAVTHVPWPLSPKTPAVRLLKAL